MRIFWCIFLIICFASATLFAFFNPTLISVDFLVATREVSVSCVMLLGIALGILMSLIVLGLPFLRVWFLYRRLQKASEKKGG